MYFVVLVLVVAVLVSWLRGGRLHRLGQAPLRSVWLLFTGVVLQLAADIGVIVGWFDGASTLSYALLLASQLVVLAWVLTNWQLPGVVLVALGLLLNALVMGANGAMPVHPDAIVALGGEPTDLLRGKHVLLDEGTQLWWLADIWPLPPIRTIISLGDVVLAAGLLPVAHHLMTYRTPRERRTAAADPDDATGSEPGDHEAPGSAH